LKIQFENFGAGQPCKFAQALQRADSRRWETKRRLRVGQSVARLQHRYPKATRHGSTFWLRSAISQCCGARYPVLAARTRHGRVTGFKGWIGAAGE
jgi:hypothetical protein